MLKEVISAVSNSLYSEFGNTHKIYADNIEQNLARPSFFLNIIRPAVSEKLMSRSYVSVPMIIQYFPSSNEKRSECHEVMERLMNALETITVDGDLCRGTNMNGEVVDNVLSFFVNYDMYVYKEKAAEPTMETVIHDTNLKG